MEDSITITLTTTITLIEISRPIRQVTKKNLELWKTSLRILPRTKKIRYQNENCFDRTVILHIGMDGSATLVRTWKRSSAKTVLTTRNSRR